MQMFQPVQVPSSGDYSGLDANGNTAADRQCLADPNCDMTAHLKEIVDEAINATGSGWLPCGDVNNPNCGPSSNDGIPQWMILVGIVAAGWITLEILEKR